MYKMIFFFIFLFSSHAVADFKQGDWVIQPLKNQWRLCEVQGPKSSPYLDTCDFYDRDERLDVSLFKESKVVTSPISSLDIPISPVDQYGFLKRGDEIQISFRSHYDPSGRNDFFEAAQVEKIYVFEMKGDEHFLVKTVKGDMVERFYQPSSESPSHTGYGFPEVGDLVIAPAHKKQACWNPPYLNRSAVLEFLWPFSSFKKTGNESVYMKTEESYTLYRDTYMDEFEPYPEDPTHIGEQSFVEYWDYDPETQEFSYRILLIEVEKLFSSLAGYFELAVQASVVSSELHGQSIFFAFDSYGWPMGVEPETQRANISLGDKIIGNQIVSGVLMGQSVAGFNDKMGEQLGVNTVVIDEDNRVYLAVLCTKSEDDPRVCEAFEKPDLYIIEESQINGDEYGPYFRHLKEKGDVDRC